jgi:hypothetical protein
VFRACSRSMRAAQPAVRNANADANADANANANVKGDRPGLGVKSTGRYLGPSKLEGR